MTEFVWRDGERTIRFGAGSGAHAWAGADVLTTARAERDIPCSVLEGARVHHVPSGQVPGLAAALIDRVGDGRMVACGGGRVGHLSCRDVVHAGALQHGERDVRLRPRRGQDVDARPGVSRSPRPEPDRALAVAPDEGRHCESATPPTTSRPPSASQPVTLSPSVTAPTVTATTGTP